MKKFFIALLACVLGATASHAQKTKAEISSEITTLFPENTVGAITPTALRTVTNDIAISIMPTAPVVANNTACFNGTTGLLKDCGVPPSLLIVGTTAVSSGISNGLLYNNGGILANTVAAQGGLLNTNAFSAPAITPTPVIGVAGSVLGTLGFQNLTSGTITLQPATGALGASILTLPAATDTLVGKATVDTFTNKIFDTGGTGNLFNINGLAVGANTGTGAMARANSPVFVTPNLGTPSAAILTNATGLPVSGLAAQGAYTFVGNNSGSSAIPTAVDIAGLTTKGSPAAGDFVILSDQSASGAWKKATVGTVGSVGSVASIAGNTGAFTLGLGLTNTVNDIKMASGAIIGSALGTYIANAILAATIPADDTIPQSTEGTQIISVSYTPRSASSTLRVRFSGQVSCASIDNFVGAMFNGASNAFSASENTVSVANALNAMAFEGNYAPGSTSAQTITLRVGCSSSSSALNGFPGARRMGGVSTASLTVEEIAP